MGEQGNQYDVAVLGGGPGGYSAALRAAGRGARAALVEAGALGGACLNVGCIPTKAMLHASETFWRARRAEAFGLRVQAAGVDGPAFMRRVRRTVDAQRRGLAGLLKARGIDVIAGRGRLAGRGAIDVEGVGAVRAKSIILATGSRPTRPAGFPWDSPRVLTTDEAATAEGLPASIIVIGGGVIGCEFTTIYAELGIRTVVVEMLDRLLGNLDAEAARFVSRSLAERGAEVLTGRRVTGVSTDADGVALALDDGKTLRAEATLVAVGRKANVEGIGLEQAGVAVKDGRVVVDAACRTSAADVYAVGDVACAMQYAHVAARMGVVAADNATGHAVSDDLSVVPMGAYTHPEVAAVGLTEEQARAACPGLRVAKFPYQASGLAQAYGEPMGTAKLMGDPATGRVLGALVVGQHATDAIQEVVLAMRHGLTVEQIAGTIHPHPTFVEALGEAAEAWCGLPRHVLR